ncbi:hypothetical protein [Candidatus Enterococcus murrayae]|uniref:Uncharacterized protein n=1 Tax=Candidatus Enterococcus murrayae TaxID=2815321 RepID=A0ABS3HGY5_9ENTE|nr:hypothetical protein [Enterococcus sp. MJM16]MBO0452713.1 hypothetical protein [Enterococcus sp. MJM16]
MAAFVLFFVKKILLGLILEGGLTIYCLKKRRRGFWFLATYFIVIHCLLVIFPISFYLIYLSDYLLVSILFFKYSNLSEVARNVLIFIDIFLFLWLSVYALFAPMVSMTYQFNNFKENGEEYVVVQTVSEYRQFAQENTTATGYIYKNNSLSPSTIVQHSSPTTGEYAIIPSIPENKSELEYYLKTGQKK